MCLPVFFVSTGDDDGPRPDGVVDPSTPAVAEGDMLEVADQRPAIDVFILAGLTIPASFVV
jgi:hypothetical protein